MRFKVGDIVKVREDAPASLDAGCPHFPNESVGGHMKVIGFSGDQYDVRPLPKYKDSHFSRYNGWSATEAQLDPVKTTKRSVFDKGNHIGSFNKQEV